MTRLDLPSPECIEGETLAAWSSGSLRATEAAAVEAHLSNCERCQSMLATFVRIEPQPAPAESVWRRWHLQWVVPIATAATVAAIWVAVPSDRPESVAQTAPLADMFEPRQPEASQSKAQSSASPPASESLRDDDKAAAPAKVAEAQAQKRDRQVQPPAAAPEGAASSALPDLRAEREAGERKREADEIRISPPPPPPPAARAVPGVAEERAAAKAPPSAPPPPPPAALQETVTLRSLNRSADTLLAKQISSPDAAHQWRISGGRQIDRSSTGGKQWETVAVLESDRLTAGHSPSPTVVWAVGPAGTIYVTSDGKRFEKVPFIEAVDLESVLAIDDRQATVTAADGRVFRTMDRGVAWTRVQ
ncbi:MAG: hypothetical protein ACREE7_07615 [Dongiaceae bacterium]